MAHMDVLLKSDVEHLGQRGDVVRVRTGYGRNYLLPQGLAIEATPGNKRMIEEQKRVLAKQEDRERDSARGQADQLEGLRLRFDRRVGDHGMLYGSVTVLDIAEALKERGFEVERRRIGLSDHIKEIGDYEVVIKLHREVSPTIKVLVRKEGAPDEPKIEETSAAEETAEAVETAPAAESSAAEAAEEEPAAVESAEEESASSEAEPETETEEA